jgi:hypothetical protein
MSGRLRGEWFGLGQGLGFIFYIGSLNSRESLPFQFREGWRAILMIGLRITKNGETLTHLALNESDAQGIISTTIAEGGIVVRLPPFERSEILGAVQAFDKQQSPRSPT